MPHRFGDSERPYWQSHPWLRFAFNTRELKGADLIRLGEALAKCDHIANVPLPPLASLQLHQINMIKGALGSVQIEGNSLSEEQAVAHVAGELNLPASQQYLQKELDNVIAASELVAAEVRDGADLRLTVARIKQFNRMVLDGLPPGEDVVPGETRLKDIVVGNVYKGAPPGDCEYLMDQLCGWLDELMKDASSAGPEWRRAMGVIRANLAHLYLAWIHPFGDGNGRTARLIEFQLLLAAGLPTPACHLLSNYYMKTRTRYYQVLQQTSRTEGYPAWRFVSYAIQGITEELNGTVAFIQGQQLGLAWMTYVGQQPLGQAATAGRRANLLLSLPGGSDSWTPVSALNRLTPELAAAYAGKQTKTITRDVNALQKADLIVRRGNTIRPKLEHMFSFLPIRRIPDDPTEWDQRDIVNSLAAASEPL